tara:strand:+ start:291 stop:482 length:192 start_codon:yes stop_codon:yes gene_type:complete
MTGYNNYDLEDDFVVSKFKGGGGKKTKPKKEKKNPDGKFTSKHVRISQQKIEKASGKREVKSK